MQKKAYAAQSKNVLLSMLADDSQIIRNKVIHIINKWRNGSQYGNECVTTCIVLELLGKIIWTYQLEYGNHLWIWMKYNSYQTFYRQLSLSHKSVTDAARSVVDLEERDVFIKAGLFSTSIVHKLD